MPVHGYKLSHNLFLPHPFQKFYINHPAFPGHIFRATDSIVKKATNKSPNTPQAIEYVTQRSSFVKSFVQEGQNPGVASLRHQVALFAVWCHQQFLLDQINNEETDITDRESDG